MGMNRITAMGRLTRDPGTRMVNGIPCATLTLAVDRDYGAKEDGSREADFLDVVAWRQTAEFAAKHLVKGRQVVVDGRLQSRFYTDKDGKNRKVHEIVADRFYFADSKRDNDRPAQNDYQPASGFEDASGDGSDLPF